MDSPTPKAPRDDPIQQLQTYFSTVVADKNLGDHLFAVFADHSRMEQAIKFYVSDRFGPIAGKPHANIMPISSLDDFYLGLEKFDFSANGKNGFYPSNCQFQAHFGEFLAYGYKPMESVSVKFNNQSGDRSLGNFQVGYVDGQCKCLIMMAIVGFCAELEFGENELQDSNLQKVLSSFGSIRCSYEHYGSPSQYFLQSLKLGYVTAEKQTPSPINIAADLNQAILAERAAGHGGPKTPLKDMLGKTVAKYNQLCTNKKHRIESTRRSMVYNLLRAPAALFDSLHAHYDLHKHENSGVPHEVLTQDYWVPGSSARQELDRFRGKSTFQEILTTTSKTCMIYFQRVTNDFCKKVAKNAIAKSKKLAQYTEEEHLQLHDITCCWLWVRSHMETTCGGDVVDKHDELFMDGHLDSDLGSLMKSGEEFDWSRVPFVLEATGRTMDTYVAAHQDKSKNALSKAMEASFVAWGEELKADQAQFCSEKVSMEKEGAKARAKLVSQLEDCHKRSWDAVSNYLKESLALFVGKTNDAESTVMPASRSWIRDMALEHGNHPDDHGILLWCNCPSMGVISASRSSFLLNYISNVLADFPLNSACILIHPNRASQQEGRKPGAKKEDASDDEAKVKVKEDQEDETDESDGDDERKNAHADLEDMVRKVRFNLETNFRMRDRNLKVKNLTFVFDPASVYGKREGALSGLMILSGNSKNIFRQTKAFKTGVVHGIEMLARSNMVKPESVSPQRGSSTLPHLGRAFTDIQEMKQVAGGTDFIQKVVEAMHVPTIKAKIMLDLNAYDGFAALACVEDMCKGNAAVCGSLCLDHSGTDLMSRVSNKVYEHCRSGAISLPGFPDFNPIIHALKSHQPVERQKSFRVSVQQMDRLVVLQSLAQKWLDTESTRERALKIISDNCDGQYWLEERREVSASENASRAEEQPRKRIKLEAFSEQDISKLGNVKKFSVNNSLDLILAGQHGDQLFASSRSRNQFFEGREMFSYGSGEWRDGREAEECLQDSEGRWMSFSAKKDTLLILEKKGLPSHIKLENLEVAVTLQSLVCDLQDAGEAKLEVSHHKLKDEDWVSVKPLVFVMDNPPEEGSGKKRGRNAKAGVQITMKNFGSWMSITKVKANESTLKLAWRVRLDCSSGDGTKVLTPIRPVAILGHDLDIGQETVRLM